LSNDVLVAGDGKLAGRKEKRKKKKGKKTTTKRRKKSDLKR